MQSFIYPEPVAVPSLPVVREDGKLYYFEINTFTWKQPAHPAHGYYNEHRHDVYHLVLFTGNSRMAYRGQVLTVKAGSLILCSPGESHNFSSLDDRAVFYHELTISCRNEEHESLRLPYSTLLARLFQTNDAATAVTELGPGDRGKLETAYQTVAAALADPGLPYAAGAILTLLGLAARLIAMPAATPDFDGKLEQSLHYLKRLDAPKPQLGAVAQKIGWSKEYFCRKFKEKYGVSPLAQYQKMRLEGAAQMLRSSDLSQKEIAAKLHFSDIYHFNKAFAAYHHIAPGQYRRLQNFTVGRSSNNS